MSAVIWVACNKHHCLSTNKKLLVSWQFSGPYGVTKYGSGWRKDVVNQCMEFVLMHVLDSSWILVPNRQWQEKNEVLWNDCNLTALLSVSLEEWSFYLQVVPQEFWTQTHDSLETGQCFTCSSIIRWKLQNVLHLSVALLVSWAWSGMPSRNDLLSVQDYSSCVGLGAKGSLGIVMLYFHPQKPYHIWFIWARAREGGEVECEPRSTSLFTQLWALSGVCFKDPDFEFDPSDVKPLSVVLPSYLKWFSLGWGMLSG